MTDKIYARAAQPATPINFDVPAHACDCHTHIHGDIEKFPFFAGRVYTPGPASPEEMAALHKALHVERVVIVAPRSVASRPSSTSAIPSIAAVMANFWSIELTAAPVWPLL